MEAVARCAAASRECKAASLRVGEVGVDSGTSYVFVIGSGRPSCPVTELSQVYGWTGGNLSTGQANSISCRLTSVTGTGVMLGCGRHSVLIPSAVAAPGAGWDGLPPASCPGQVFASHVDSSTQALSGTDPGVLACFSTAARQCRPASIAVTVSPGNGAGTVYEFHIEPGTDACHVTELSQHWGMNGAGWWTSQVTSLPCRLTTVTGRGVRLKCAGQDVLIPADGGLLGSRTG